MPSTRSRRRSNYELAHSIETLLRKLVASGLTRDKALAEDLIADLNERLCPRPTPKYAETAPLPADPMSRKVGSAARPYGKPNWRR